MTGCPCYLCNVYCLYHDLSNPRSRVSSAHRDHPLRVLLQVCRNVIIGKENISLAISEPYAGRCERRILL